MSSRLSASEDFRIIGEVNPPQLPELEHLLLEGKFSYVLITDNPFKTIRVSPYAFAARITHDLPEINPTIVVSTRDRNVLAIESEVRGALVNGVGSFLVVSGDSVDGVKQACTQYDVVAHLLNLRNQVPIDFEVGMSLKFSKEMHRKRIDFGSKFFATHVAMDPNVVAECAGKLLLEDSGPVYLGVVPPFSRSWVERIQNYGGFPCTDKFLEKLPEKSSVDYRYVAWENTNLLIENAKKVGFAGVILMGLTVQTLVGEAFYYVRR